LLPIYTDIRMEKKRSGTRRQTSCPTIGALLRYKRAMIESLDTAGRAFVSTVKWGSLHEFDAQLF
jgi:hypothetical protein